MGSVCAAGAETGQCASLELSRIRLYSLYISEKKMLHATSAQTSCAEAWQWRSYCNVHVYLSRYTDAVSSPAGYHGKHHRMWAKASTQSRLQAAYSNSARKLPGMEKQTSCSGTGLGYLMGLCLA